MASRPPNAAAPWMQALRGFDPNRDFSKYANTELPVYADQDSTNQRNQQKNYARNPSFVADPAQPQNNFLTPNITALQNSYDRLEEAAASGADMNDPFLRMQRDIITQELYNAYLQQQQMRANPEEAMSRRNERKSTDFVRRTLR